MIDPKFKFKPVMAPLSVVELAAKEYLEIMQTPQSVTRKLELAWWALTYGGALVQGALKAAQPPSGVGGVSPPVR
jgi:hypothetical protein